MSSHPYWVAIILGVIYLLVWGVYRSFRWWEHRVYRELHRAEHLRRADYGIAHPNLDPQEHLRRVSWDAEHGPLMGPLELKNREESRWPAGAAIQGAATVTMSLLIAAIIWSARLPAEPGGRPLEGHREDGPVIHLQVPEREYSSLPLVLSVSSVLLAVGGGLLLFSKSTIGKASGATLAITASLLSGMKLLSIDKLLAADTLIKFSYDPTYGTNPGPQPDSFSTSLKLKPPFDSGVAKVNSQLECAAKSLARHLAADPDVSSIIIVGRADRQELSPRARQRYASNWGLAQQRGVSIEKLLSEMQILRSKMIVTTSGPLFTADTAPGSGWDSDRVVTVVIQGRGTVHPWMKLASKAGEWQCDAAVQRDSGY